MKRGIQLLLLLISYYGFSQSPGGVGEVSLWMKTDSGQSAGLLYTDYSNNQLQISAGGSNNKPQYSLLNYNETLNFDGVDDFLKIPYVMETLDKVSLFTVYKNKNIVSESAVFTTDQSGEKELLFSTANVFRYNNDQLNYLNINQIDSAASFSMYSKMDVPSQGIKNVSGFAGISKIYVGKDTGQNNWSFYKGLLPEFFIYRKILTQNERNRIDSYLAIKYAITMPLTEYLSSKSVKVWKSSDFGDYPRNIAGIARDGFSGLYQKQATSSSEQKRLVIAAKELAINNKQNLANFSDHTFLIWGNNTNTLELDTASFGYQLLKRKWKTRFTSETNNTISAEVAFKVSDIIPNIPSNKKIWLIIDRSGNGNFNSTSLDAFPANSIDSNGNARFKNITFDQDLSGTDVFTFALGGKMLALHEVKQPTCVNPSGVLNLNLIGGSAPFNVNLSTTSGNAQNITYPSSQITFNNLSVGSYSAVITDAGGIVTNFNFQINDFNNISLNLGADQELTQGNYIELDASQNISDPLSSYQWTSSTGYTSSNPKIKVYDPGEYTVTVTTSDGCKKTDTIKITKARKKGIFIYPNPVHAGDQFTILILSDQKENVDIKIYDSAGRLVKTINDSGKDTYEYKESLPVQGAYIIMVRTTTDIKAFKLIVN